MISNVTVASPECCITVFVLFVIQEDIEVKKDTERADEIRALKKAWEDADPGRAAKVRGSSFVADQIKGWMQKGSICFIIW